MAARPGERGIVEEISLFYNGMPVVTRSLFAGTLGLSLAAGLKVIQPHQLLFIPSYIFTKYQIWRLVTAYLWQPLGFPFLMNLYFLYQQSRALETGLFVGRTADYVFFILFSIGAINVAAYFLELFMLSDPLLMSIVYVWSMHNRDQRVSFMFGVQFKAIYLPWALVAMDVLQGNPLPIAKLAGIAVGFVYFYLDQTYPAQNNGRKVLNTPQILYKYFPPPAGGSGGGAAAGYRFVPPVQAAGGGPAAA
ncbi:Derlin 1, partial [Thoreauomyces humboldtii]